MACGFLTGEDSACYLSQSSGVPEVELLGPESPAWVALGVEKYAGKDFPPYTALLPASHLQVLDTRGKRDEGGLHPH